MKIIKVAACQLMMGSESDLRKKQLKTWLEKAEAEKVDFICFPEGAITGYYPDKTQAYKHSLQVGDITFQEWLDLFSTYSPTIIIGFNERNGSDLFDSAAIIEQGKLLGVQRKHYLYHDYFTPATSFTAYTSKGITFGVVICLDTNYFEPSRILALQEASILFSPMCNRVPVDHPYAIRPPYYSHFVARSFENRCWLVSSDWIWPNDKTSTCPGHSVVYDSDGKEVARSSEGKEELLLYNIPLYALKTRKGRRVFGSSALFKKCAEDHQSIK